MTKQDKYLFGMSYHANTMQYLLGIISQLWQVNYNTLSEHNKQIIDAMTAMSDD